MGRLEDKLKRIYEDLPRDEALRQGRDHLANDAVQRVKRTHRILVAVQWTLIVLALAAIGIGALALLFHVKHASAAMEDQRAKDVERFIDR